MALRFYAAGTFQSVLAEMFGVNQPTAGRSIHRVTLALLQRMQRQVCFPNQLKANQQKVKFYEKAGFPNVIGCIDGTQIRIQSPTENEHEYVNRKNFHSTNVQVIITITWQPLFIKFVLFDNFLFICSFNRSSVMRI